LIPLAYLDSNILIAYFWSHYFGSDSRQTNEIKLVEKAFSKEYELALSTFSMVELYEHFRDYYLLDKTIKRGYGFREFSRVRHDHDLTITSSEEERINQIFDDFENKEGVVMYEVEKITDKFFVSLWHCIRGNIDFYDAIHVLTAIDLKCDYFVTRDAGIRKHYEELSRKQIIDSSMKMATVSGFLKELNQ
jgi:predicted nucleic acid-binding protein